MSAVAGSSSRVTCFRCILVREGFNWIGLEAGYRQRKSRMMDMMESNQYLQSRDSWALVGLTSKGEN